MFRKLDLFPSLGKYVLMHLLSLPHTAPFLITTPFPESCVKCLCF